MVVEFRSTSDDQGVFRKYAAYNVGGRIHGRSLNAGRQWMLKLGTSDFTRDLVLEDQRYVMDNPHKEQLAEIFAFANIDFGQMDYSVKRRAHSDMGNQCQSHHWSWSQARRRNGGGRTGAHPERNPRVLLRQISKGVGGSRFHAAGMAPVDVVFDSAVVAAAARGRPSESRARSIARTLLGPVKPLLRPAAAKLLARLALRR